MAGSVNVITLFKAESQDWRKGHFHIVCSYSDFFLAGYFITTRNFPFYFHYVNLSSQLNLSALIYQHYLIQRFCAG